VVPASAVMSLLGSQAVQLQSKMVRNDQLADVFNLTLGANSWRSAAGTANSSARSSGVCDILFWLMSQTGRLSRLVGEEEMKMRGSLAWVIGIGLAPNGVMMVAVPFAWYMAMPGVTETGPFNPHFVRDIGAAYLVAGVALAWFAVYPRARPAAQAGTAFLTLHALVHLWDAAAGREHVHQLLIDLPTVLLPPVLAIWIAWPRRAFNKEKSRDRMVLAEADRRLRTHLEL
jgi:hypothetical protein